jgi:serine/threonine protein kinase
MFQVPNFTPIRELSSGGQNIVYAASHEVTGEIVVIKGPSNTQSLQTVVEANILRTISHPRIIPLKGVIRTENGPALILPYYSNGDLLDRINDFGPFPESDVKVIIFHILTALTYLHANRIAHRDIKLENLSLASENHTDVVLGDFVFASLIPAEGFCTPVGTLPYLAPEMWRSSTNRYSHKVDIWALGVTMYILMTGQVLYQTEDWVHPLESIGEAIMNLHRNEALDHVSPVGRNFLSLLLKIDPDQRINADDALKHEWFQFLDFCHSVHSHFTRTHLYNYKVNPK